MNKKVSLLQFLVAGILIFTLSMAFSQTARASHTSVEIVAIPSESDGQANTLARVFSEPDDASSVIEVLSPGTHFNILGFNESGSYIQIAKEGQTNPSGWLAASVVSRNHLDSTSRSITKAYAQPSSTSQFTSIVTPGEQLQVLGHSIDGLWLAIENPGSFQTPIYWIAASEITLPDVTAKTSTLTKLYLIADTSSRITNVLPPAMQVTLFGRNGTSSWFAVEDSASHKFIGWAQISDLNGGMNRELLPVLAGR
jgi:hypothetical protein